MSQRRRACGILAAALATLAAAPSHAAAGAPGRGPDARVRMNELQTIGTHNSYKRELSPREEAAFDQLVQAPGSYAELLAYSHASLRNQLARQDVRGLELDLFPDPAGGLYAQPLVRTQLGLGPLPDPAWTRPGIKVLHVADLDYATTCVTLVACLRQVRTWSKANPRHVPLLILLELKGSEPGVVAAGGVAAPPWDAGALDALDAEIRSVFGEDHLLTPDDVRRRGLSLERSVLRRGWPTLARSRGKVAFLLDNEPVLDGAPNPIRAAYTAGRPSLEGRVLFTNGVPGEPDTAFLKRNDPTGADGRRIRGLVRRGYLVRTRSDLPLATVRSGDRSLLRRALASGAQLVSTDVPEVGMSARYGSDFVAELPGGAVVRCNPVTARRACRSARLEPARRR
jgi:hypothetical protein